MFNKMKSYYYKRSTFLRSFPLLDIIPELYFHSYLPSLKYEKYLVNNELNKNAQDKIFFLKLGEIQFSKI